MNELLKKGDFGLKRGIDGRTDRILYLTRKGHIASGSGVVVNALSSELDARYPKVVRARKLIPVGSISKPMLIYVLATGAILGNHDFGAQKFGGYLGLCIW
ncbi:hypothetical protein ACFORG_16340 [Lutimaribacter marinistellae]|uniref:Beta-lactamase n=1 Tax=Lutimaribacter marinistellae TaxID=1820329 RepID=A0ABV7TLL0_9RHOB